MAKKTSEFKPAFRRLERRAAESIYEDMDSLTVVRTFDFSEITVYNAAELEEDGRYSYEPEIQAFYCKEVAALTTQEFASYSLMLSVPARSASILNTLL